MKINTSFNPIQLFLYAFFSLALAGCASIGHDSSYRGPFPRPEWLADAYSPGTDWTALKQEVPGKGFERITLTQPGCDPEDDSSIQMDFYRYPHEGRYPALLVSPIFGGKNRVASHFARYLSKRGYHCLVVHRPPDLKNDLDSPDVLEERLASAVRRDRAALDWLEKQPGVASEALGSFGISYGGIKNVVLAGVDERLKVNVFALAGGDVASIVTHSNLKKLNQIVQKMLDSHDWMESDLEQHLREVILTEPLRMAPRVDPQTTLLFIARCDATVPRRNGELLRQALGQPKTIYLPTGHYSGIFLTGMVGFPYVESQTLAFLDRNLEPLMCK